MKIDRASTSQQLTHRNHIIGVLLYVLAGVTWIAFSDELATNLFHGQQLLMVSTYKGWAFVALTALCLFVFLQHMVKSTRPENPDAE